MLRKVLTITLLFATLAMFGQQAYVKSYTITVAGTSNIHDWESQVSSCTGSCQMILDENQKVSINQLQVKIPVENIISDHDLMDTKTWACFESDKYPYITFRAKHVRFDAGIAYFSGTLKMHGVTKQVTFPCKYTFHDGVIVFKGSYAIDMVDYQMDPPSLMMGAISVGPIVTVHFNVEYKIS